MKRQIPNILSFLRLCMVPAFIICYFKYTVGWKVFISAGVYMIAWLTDVLDGYLARRNGWITDLGKLLDPLADKLMQLAAALCFSADNLIFLIVVIPLLVKEFGMLFASLKIMEKRDVVVASNWYGKLTTVLLFVCAFTRIIIRRNAVLDITLAISMLGLMAFSLFMYYFKVFKGKYNLSLFNK